MENDFRHHKNGGRRKKTEGSQRNLDAAHSSMNVGVQGIGSKTRIGSNALDSDSDHNMPKVLIYITTHMSMNHMWHLKSCWPPALRNSRLLRTSDIFVHQSTTEINESDAIEILHHTFRDQNLTIYTRDNIGYNKGAKAAIYDAIREGWWKGYDWVIRVNPDVIIRDDSYLLHVMKNDVNATAMLVNCARSNSNPSVHTDFFAIKPDALSPNAFLKDDGIHSAEKSFKNQIKESILDKGNHRWVEDARPLDNLCRVGSKRPMDATPIVHYHEKSLNLAKDFTCSIPF